MFTYIIKNHLKRNGRVLVLTHRKELLKQAGGSFEKFDLEPEIINAGSNPDLTKNLHIAMIETFNKRKKDYASFTASRTLIVIDEAHLNIFTKVFDGISKDTVVIGATATPYRKGKNVPALSEFYDFLVQEVDTPDLINRNFLSKAKTYGVPIDLSGAKKKGSEYDVSQIYEEKQMWHGVVENWERLAKNTKTILFSANVEQSKKVCEEFNRKGYNARHIDGKTSPKEREEILEWYELPGDRIICNCGILNAGFDQPDIETVILYRATTSLPLFLQMCGRGSRTTETQKEFTILDFGSNVNRLGFWEKRRIWSLQKDSKRSNKEGEEPIKECPECYYIMNVSVMECPECGYEFEKDKEVEEIAELQLMTYQQIKDEVKTADFKRLNQIQKAKGYKKAWIYHQLKTEKDLKQYAKFMGYHHKWVEYQLKQRGQ